MTLSQVCVMLVLIFASMLVSFIVGWMVDNIDSVGNDWIWPAWGFLSIMSGVFLTVLLIQNGVI